MSMMEPAWASELVELRNPNGHHKKNPQLDDDKTKKNKKNELFTNFFIIPDHLPPQPTRLPTNLSSSLCSLSLSRKLRSGICLILVICLQRRREIVQDEAVEVAFEDRIGVGHLIVCAKILDHPVRLQGEQGK